MVRVISMVPDQTSLISGGKGQFFPPAASVCTTALLNCKTQEAPEAAFLSRFFFFNPFSSYFLPLYKWKRRLFALPNVCLAADQWEKKMKQRNKFKPFRKHIFSTYIFALSVCSDDQISILTQNTNHSRLPHTRIRLD